MIWFAIADMLAYSCVYVGTVVLGVQIAEKFHD